MKNFALFISLLGIIILIHSCKDQGSDDFFAGKTEDIFYYDFDPDLGFPSPDTKDSIDINHDSKYEFYFGIVSVAGPTGFITLPVIYSTQDLLIMIAGPDNMPSALSLGDKISSSENWSTPDDTLLLFSYKFIYPQTVIPIGFWKDQQNKYLGIKYKDKFGWIKMSTTPGYCIKEIGFEK